jgi:hypothetical protein
LLAVVLATLAGCQPSAPPRSAADLCAAQTGEGQQVDRAVPATVGDIKDWMTEKSRGAKLLGPDGKTSDFKFDWSSYSDVLSGEPLDARVAVCVISAVKGMMLLSEKFSADFGWVEAMVIIAGPGKGWTFHTAGPRDKMLSIAPASFPYEPPPKPERESP